MDYCVSMRRHGGFTLIELSIVLVIIGLIVGGVLVGRDLITAAKIRKQVTQIEQFNAATMTFKGKYDCLPGDCKNAGTRFGFVDSGGGGGSGNGDGNITCSAMPGAACWFTPDDSGENIDFWLQLSQAHLISPPPCTDYSVCGGGGAYATYAAGPLQPKPVLDRSWWQC